MYSENELDDLISKWHDDKSILITLHEFLGWTFAEYAHWVQTCEQPNHSK